MIEAKELRIGNWVQTNHNGKNKQGTIIEITNHHIHLISVNKVGGILDLMEDVIDPIPLTPEILEKCGFVLSYDDTFVSKKYFKKNGFNQLKDYGQQSIVLSDKGNYLECGYYENQIECNSVHQLQNLYFALTGEELTVNL